MKVSERANPLVIPYVLIFSVIVLRLAVVHPYNFVPIFSCLLFFAAMRPAREFALPLVALIGTDMYLTTQQYGFVLSADALVTWFWYGIVMLLGANILRSSRSWFRVAGSSLGATMSFFVASNFAVWAVWNMYPKTLGGLGTCYVAAIPFFRNSLISEFFFSLLLFGLAGYTRSLMAVSISEELATGSANTLRCE